ncbi:MFS transporter [Lysinibacillus alkalisoli]|uniref:MFS transporter n=1 Tax=Lysinibacillus alkalisoli TaxID=1911548 RepID=A0A917LEB6_9BACI|nr:MDR family MFS transporter [Lysinibacillus alkalisoli]GGG15228.1 MFS transporter [Lysinibacillus alkalisoli]
MNKVFIALLLVTALAAIEGTIVSTAIPSITADLSGVDLISWIYSAYLLASAIAAIIFGKLADLFGRKRMILIGITIFLVGSMLCGLAQSMEQLIIFRAIQGIGAGSILPLTLTMVGELFTTEKARAKGQGYLSMVWGVSGVVGPLFGGFIVDQITWHFIFFINVPFGLASMYLIVKHYQEEITAVKRKIDYAGAALFTVGMVSLLYVIIDNSKTQAWFSTQSLLLYGVALLFLTVFIMVELRAEEPIIPLSLFKNWRLMVVNGLTFSAMSVVIGVTVYIPIYAQSVLGKNATQAGLMLTPLSVLWTVNAIVAGNLIGRLTNKRIIQMGTVLLVIGTFLLAGLLASSGSARVYIGSSLIGLGMGLIMPMLMISIQKVADPKQLGTSIGLNSFTNTFSQAMGAALFGMLFNLVTSTKIASLNKGEVQLNGAFAKSGFTTEEVSFLQTTIASGVAYVYLAALVFAGLACVLSFFVATKSKAQA